MTRTDPTPGGGAQSAGELLGQLAGDRWGQVAVGLYDTGRLVALAPWLAGHQARVDFLCRRQCAGGGWGGPDGYALVPTLSATAALLAEWRRRAEPAGWAEPDRTARVRRAATRGLHALRGWLEPGAPLVVPDTIAVELIVPALLEDLAELLTTAPAPPGVPADPARWLRSPAGFDPELLAKARARFAAGPPARKSWACLEVFGPAAAGAPLVRPAGGSVGCSPAATAAWLGAPPGPREAAEPQEAAGPREAAGFLEALQARGGGPVPGVTPITYFEAAWVLNGLAAGGFTGAGRRGGRRIPVPAAILDRLEAGLTGDGAPAAPGLPADADDTAAVLAALLRHGRVRAPGHLLRYRTDGYFTCFPDERNPSVSTNAHVLEALALHLARRRADRDRFAGPAATATEWLLAQQEPEGNWWDKWHASPYYATACCVGALGGYGGEPARGAVRRARAWVLATQRPDGSWGRWEPTVEETAYAVQILAAAGAPPAGGATARAIARGCALLADPPPPTEYSPLWHAKDLYTPVAVVEAARLAALGLADQLDDRLAGRLDSRATVAGAGPSGAGPGAPE